MASLSRNHGGALCDGLVALEDNRKARFYQKASHNPSNMPSFSKSKSRSPPASPNSGSNSRPSSSRRGHNNYRSFPDHHEDRDPLQTATSGEIIDYRGFSTSIHDMFTSPDNERVDCCAMTCCGVLQTDRDRYLLQGVPPPGAFKRITVHIVVPLCVFMIAGLCATHIANVIVNQIVSVTLLLFLFIYLSLQCYKGRMKRVGIRKDLLYLKYQIHHNTSRQDLLTLLDHERPDDADGEFYLGQSERDFTCAHLCCGLYAEDRKVSGSTGTVRDANMCSRLWTSCWHPICGMHLQTCGLCAVAQEGREMEHVLLPPSYRRIDYISMQAVTDYYPAIYRARWEEEERSSWQRPPLSRLAVRLLQTLAGMTAMLLFWAVAGPIYWKYIVQTYNKSHAYQIWDFLIFVATYGGSILLLFGIVWYVNRIKPSELSTDALIKFFASGFFLATSLAVFWELVASLLVRLIISLLMAIAGVDSAEDPQTNSSSGGRMGGWMIGFGANRIFRSASQTSAKDFMDAFGNDHPVVYSIYILFNAFCLAAFVEELCKYFGYRMVEHPDFMSQRDLEEATRVRLGEYEDYDQGVDDEEPNRGRPRRRREDYSKQRQSLQAQGAAITLAMVAVAMGFTCCENLVYIFVYSDSTPAAELSVLITRSLFPVHPIAAAMQSIAVCRRDLESDRNCKLGKIVLPAIIFHGAYDFFILWIDFLARRNGVYAQDGGDSAFDAASAVAVLISFLVSILIIGIALLYLYRESKAQRQRLNELDQTASVDRSGLL